jgi:hypothetical protein
MRNFMKTLLLIGGLIVLQGCASHQNFVKKQDAWVGKRMAYFIGQNGYPDSTYILPNKNKVYVYARSRVYTIPSMPMFGYGYYNSYGMFGYGNEVVHESCKLFVETNKKGKIVRWGSRGNHCVSH